VVRFSSAEAPISAILSGWNRESNRLMAGVYSAHVVPS
jgi:hypothetical protein